MNGTTYRTLSKISGLRFVVTVSGTGGRFNILNLFIAIGNVEKKKLMISNEI